MQDLHSPLWGSLTNTNDRGFWRLLAWISITGIQRGYSRDEMRHITRACLKIGYIAGKGPQLGARDDNVITWGWKYWGQSMFWQSYINHKKIIALWPLAIKRGFLEHTPYIPMIVPLKWLSSFRISRLIMLDTRRWNMYRIICPPRWTQIIMKDQI